MQAVKMLVSPDGKFLLPDTAEFFAALGDPNPDYDAEAFAIKNLGFIKISEIDRTIIEIELHPRNVAVPAVLAAQQRVQSAGVNLFRIRYFDTMWRSEITASAEQAMVRLSQLTAQPVAVDERNRFIVEPQDYSTMYNDQTNPLRPLAQKWRMSFGVFNTGLIPFAIANNLLPSMIIVGVTPPADPVFRFIGEAHANWAGSRYPFTGIGDKLVNFPDKEYGEWVAEYYKSVANTGQPRYDHITASIQREPTAYVTHYERLMLPWTTQSGEMLVTMVSKRLPSESEPEKYSGFDSPLLRTVAKSA